MIGLLISSGIALIILFVIAVVMLFSYVIERQFVPRCRLCDRRRRPPESLFAQCPNRKKP